MARYSGMPQSLLIRRFTSQDIMEIMANEEIKLKERNTRDKYYNGLMNQIGAVFGGGNYKFVDYTEAWSDPITPEEQAQKRLNTYRMLTNG